MQPARPHAGTLYMPLSDAHIAVPADVPSPDATPGCSVRISETTVVIDETRPQMPSVYYFVTFTVDGAEYELSRDWNGFRELQQRLALTLGALNVPNFPDADVDNPLAVETRERNSAKLQLYWQRLIGLPALLMCPVMHDALELDFDSREHWSVIGRAALNVVLANQGSTGPKTGAGRLFLTGIRVQVEPIDPTKKDKKESDLDPYVVIKWKGRELHKTPHKDNTNTGAWPGLAVIITFELEDLENTNITVQCYDHRTILSDTLVGELTAPLKFFVRAHANAYPDNQVQFALLGKDHSKETAKCTLEMFVDSARLVTMMINAAAENTALEGVKALLAVTTTPAPDRIPRIAEYWSNDALTRISALARSSSGELQRFACQALVHYRSSLPARAQGAALSTLWEPTAKKPFLQALLTLTPTEFSVLAPALAEPRGVLERAVDDFLAIQGGEDSEIKSLLFLIAGGKPSSPTEWAFGHVIEHQFAPLQSTHIALVQKIEGIILTTANLSTSIGCFCSIIVLRAYYHNPMGFDVMRMVQIMNTIWRSATPEVVMLGMHVVSHLSRTVAAEAINMCFANLPTLHPEVIAWHLGLKVLDLVGAVPPLPPAGSGATEGLVPNSARPPYVVDFELPSATNEARFAEYGATRVHFVMQSRTSEPISLAMSVLDLPGRCQCPTFTAAVFLCDTIPDVSLFYAFDGISSGAQFFDVPVPPGAHAACFIDARASDGIQRHTRCVSRYVDPARYIYVRLIGSGFPNDPTARVHQLQSLRFLGVNSDALMQLNLPPHSKLDLMTTLPTTLVIPARPSHERCLVSSKPMDEEPAGLNQMSLGGGQLQYVVYGGSRYPVRVLNGVHTYYQPWWFIRTRMQRSVLTAGRTKHRVKTKNSSWLVAHRNKRHTTFASRRVGRVGHSGFGHHHHGFHS